MSDYEEVLAIARQHLQRVKRSGPDNIMASCPFHTSDDAHGSVTFSMSLSRGIYFCFSCHASGTLRTFLRDVGVAPYAVELQYKGLIERLRAAAPPPKDVRKFNPTAIDPLPENLLGIFDYCPTKLREVGFTERTLRSFDVGYDQYHNKITFPLRDIEGRLVGISGRKLEGEGQRYKIYTNEYATWGLPKRSMNDSSRKALIWNIHRAMPECVVAGKPIILVEGFKACMWLWQCGYTNVAAIMGSLVTDEQRWILEQMGVPIILMLDGNEPGRDGTYRSGRRLQDSLHVRVARVPEDEQPDDLSQEQIAHVLEGSVIFQQWASKQKGIKRWNESQQWGRTPR